MGFVLADKFDWLNPSGEPPFTVVPLQTFEKLRDAVNDNTADFFMWEHFTSKRYFENGEIKKVGEIYTPWSSWKIAARNPSDGRLEALFEKLNQGVDYFLSHQEEAVSYISSELDYSKEDATTWLRTVKFAENVKVIRDDTIAKTIEVLQKAGVIGEDKNPKLTDIVGKSGDI